MKKSNLLTVHLTVCYFTLCYIVAPRLVAMGLGQEI